MFVHSGLVFNFDIHIASLSSRTESGVIKHSDGLTVTSPTIMWVKVYAGLSPGPFPAYPRPQAHSQPFSVEFQFFNTNYSWKWAWG
jgi:hypothetical protein